MKSTQDTLARRIGLRNLLTQRRIRFLNRLVATAATIAVLLLFLAYLAAGRREIRRELLHESERELANLSLHLRGILGPAEGAVAELERSLLSGRRTPQNLEEDDLPSPSLLHLSAIGFLGPDGLARVREAPGGSAAGIQELCPTSGGPEIMVWTRPGGEGSLLLMRPVVSHGASLGCVFAALPLDALYGDLDAVSLSSRLALAIALDSWQTLLAVHGPGPGVLEELRPWLAGAARRGPGMVAEDERFRLAFNFVPVMGHRVLAGVAFPRGAEKARLGELALEFLPLALAGLAVILLTSFLIGRLTSTSVRLEEGLKTSEARRQHRDLMEMTYNGVVILDGEGRILHANEAAAAMLGKSRKEVEGSNFYGYVRTGQCLMEGAEHLPNCDFLLLSFSRPDGNARHCEAVSRAYREDGSEREILVLADTTEKYIYLEKKRHLEKLATLGEVAAKLTHEISSPLQGIILYADQGSLKCGGDACRDYFAKIKAQAERISGISTDYLKLSRPSSGELTLADPGSLVEEALTFFILTGPGKHMQVTRRIDPGVPAVHVDRGKMTQVLLNLFVNAAHAMEEREEKKLLVSVSATEAAEVAISVADNGTGIPSDRLDRIFDPFYSSKPEGQGTGLGLAVVKEIIERAYGGSVQVESEVGRGTTFTLLIPTGVRNSR